MRLSDFQNNQAYRRAGGLANDFTIDGYLPPVSRLIAWAGLVIDHGPMRAVKPGEINDAFEQFAVRFVRYRIFAVHSLRLKCARYHWVCQRPDDSINGLLAISCRHSRSDLV